MTPHWFAGRVILLMIFTFMIAELGLTYYSVKNLIVGDESRFGWSVALVVCIVALIYMGVLLRIVHRDIIRLYGRL